MKTSAEFAAADGMVCPGCERVVPKGTKVCTACDSTWVPLYRKVVAGYIDFEPGPYLPALDNTREDEA